MGSLLLGILFSILGRFKYRREFHVYVFLLSAIIFVSFLLFYYYLFCIELLPNIYNHYLYCIVFRANFYELQRKKISVKIKTKIFIENQRRKRITFYYRSQYMNKHTHKKGLSFTHI